MEIPQGRIRHAVRACSFAFLDLSDGLGDLCQSCQLWLASRRMCIRLHELIIRLVIFHDVVSPGDRYSSVATHCSFRQFSSS